MDGTTVTRRDPAPALWLRVQPASQICTPSRGEPPSNAVMREGPLWGLSNCKASAVPRVWTAAAAGEGRAAAWSLAIVGCPVAVCRSESAPFHFCGRPRRNRRPIGAITAPSLSSASAGPGRRTTRRRHSLDAYASHSRRVPLSGSAPSPGKARPAGRSGRRLSRAGAAPRRIVGIG